jgi:hypothetical protein
LRHSPISAPLFHHLSDYTMFSDDNFALLSQILGWGYFLCWSLSFYPQVLLNYRRKSVAGYSIDFVTLNTIGFACYAVYSLNFFYNPDVRREYRQRHNGHDNSVALNDVFFAVHVSNFNYLEFRWSTLNKLYRLLFCAPLHSPKHSTIPGSTGKDYHLTINQLPWFSFSLLRWTFHW